MNQFGFRGLKAGETNIADGAVDAAPYPQPVYAWSVAALLFCAAILSYTDRQVLSLVVDPVRAELHIDDTGMSLLLGTAFALIYGIAGVPLGWLADRSSRRNLILAGVAVWSLGTIACGLAHSFAELFAARIVVGLGEAALSPAAISLLSDTFPESKRGRAVGLYFTGICVGVGGSFLIGGAVLKLVEAGVFAAGPLAGVPAWRLMFFVIGVPSLLFSLAILAIREPIRRMQTPVETKDQVTEREKNAEGVDRRALWLAAPVFATVALASLVDNAVGAWAPSLLVRDFHADAGAVGLELGYVLIFAYGGGMLAGGWLADAAAARRGRRGKIELCAFASLAIVPVALLLNTPSAAAVMTGVALYFALSAVVTASGLSAILDAAPNRVRGLAMAISFFLNVALGAGLGPTAVVLAGQTLFGAAAGLGPAIAVTMAVAAAAAAASAFVSLRMTAVRGVPVEP
jgi:MFS family permease